MYDDTILIKLRRDYGKDEMVLWALNQIKSLKARNERLSSEINEVRIENKNIISGKVNRKELEQRYKQFLLDGEIKLTKEEREEFLKDKFIEGLHRGNEKLRNQNKRYRGEIQELTWKINSKL
jgi:hypothetical protein